MYMKIHNDQVIKFSNVNNITASADLKNTD